MNVKFMFAVLTIAGGCAFNYGFHAGLLNILQMEILEWYTEVRWERDLLFEGFYDTDAFGPFLLASFPLGGVFGSLLIWTSSFLGRKLLLLCNAGFDFISLLLLSFSYVAKSYESFIVGRIMMGMSAGLGSGVVMMYLVEISPFCIRGTVGSVYYVIITASAILAHIFALEEVLGFDKLWPYIFVICYIPAFIQVFSLVFIPESPKYLFLDKEEEDEAEDSLAWFRGDSIEAELEDLREEATVLKDVGPVNLTTMIENEHLRTPLIISAVILAGQQLSGYSAVMYLSTEIVLSLDMGVRQAVEISIGLTTINMIAAIVSMVLVDRVGRKILLIVSFAVMIFTSAGISLTILLSGIAESFPEEVVYIVIFFLFIYAIAFGLGAGSIPWIYAAEINNQFARPIAMTIGVTLNWFFHFIVVMCYMPLKSQVGNYAFIIFALFDIFTLIFASMTMRETMDMETVDIIELFYD